MSIAYKENGVWKTVAGTSPIDGALSSTSENPVQNKIVKQAVDSKSDTGHNHDDRYYTKTEVDTKVTKTEALISNSGDTYDPTRPYEVNELCMHDDTLYRCITACSAGSWETNQSCFTADTLVNASNKIGTVFKGASVCWDANNAHAGLSYLPGGAANSPFSFWGSLLTIYGNPDNYYQQIAFPWDPCVNKLYYRNGVDNTWSAWKEIGGLDPSTTTVVSQLAGNGDAKLATLVHYDKSNAKPFIYVDGTKVYLQRTN